MGREYSVIGVPVHSLNESSQRAHVSIRLEVGLQYHSWDNGCPVPPCRVTMCSV